MLICNLQENVLITLAKNTIQNYYAFLPLQLKYTMTIVDHHLITASFKFSSHKRFAGVHFHPNEHEILMSSHQCLIVDRARGVVLYVV